MDLTFNVLESIRRDIRELKDDLHIEKTSRHRQVAELQQDVKDIRRDVRYLRQEVVAEHEARETSIENLRRELTEEMRREVGSVRSDIDAQRKRIRVQEEEGFITIDGTCISWGAADIAPGGAPAAIDIDFPRKYRAPPAVMAGSRDHCSFIVGTGDNGHSRIRKDGFTASALSFAGVEATRKGCAMNWMAIGPRVVDTQASIEGAQSSFAGRLPRLEQMSVDEQEKMFRALFRQADTDGNGVLDSKEFMSLLKASNLALSRTAIRRIMEEADVNEDGKIEYREFIPVMQDIIETSNAIVDSRTVDEQTELMALEAAQAYILEGMTQAELEEAARGIFVAADIDRSGFLDRSEFVSCLRALDLGLTRKEIQYAMAHVDVNHDHKVSYEEFLPMCFSIFISVVADKLLEESNKAGEAVFAQLFQAADPSNTGKIAAPQMRSILAGTGMSPTQVEVLMSEAQLGGDGAVVYAKFVRICAQYGAAFVGRIPSNKPVSEMSAEELESLLKALFHDADKDGSGALDESEFVALLRSTGLGLTRKAIFSIMEAADANEDGLIQYEEFLDMMVEIMQTQKVTREAAERMEAEEAKALQAAQQLVLSDDNKSELENSMRMMFAAADANNNGSLDRNEFLACVQTMNFGLTKREIKSLMAEVDKNQDGKIEYDEFMPLAIDIIVEVVKQKLVAGSSKLATLMDFFIEAFAAQDPARTGKISTDAMRVVLEAIGMSAVQAESLLLEAYVDGQGKVEYTKFARVAATVAVDFAAGTSSTALAAEKRRARAVALFRRIDVDNSGKIGDAEMESYVRRLAAKFRYEIDASGVNAVLDAFLGAPITEEAFADYLCQTYAGVSDEEFFHFLDFCITPSYEARVSRIRSLFYRLDADGSGVVDMAEVRGYVKKLANHSDVTLSDDDVTEVVKLFQAVDKNGDGTISEEEFIVSFLEMFELADDQHFFQGISMFDF